MLTSAVPFFETQEFLEEEGTEGVALEQQQEPLGLVQPEQVDAPVDGHKKKKKKKEKVYVDYQSSSSSSHTSESEWEDEKDLRDTAPLSKVC
jgi:hypothetical protein